jgi:hypothetical protein
MKAKTYEEKLKSPKWQKRRLEIMNRDNFTCKKCGDTETQLHVHHLEYVNGNDPWDYEDNQLVTLCEDCHTIVEQIKKEPGFDFSKLKIVKLNTWTDGGKTIFYNNGKNCVFVEYDNLNQYKGGYNFSGSSIDSIIKIFKHTKKIAQSYLPY